MVSKVGPWMLLDKGTDGYFMSGTLFFLLLSDTLFFLLLSDFSAIPVQKKSSHNSMWDQFYHLAHGQGQQRPGGSILELGQSQIWVHASFFYTKASEIRSGDLWAFDKFPSALILCGFFSPSEFKGCLLQSCTALLIYGCLWGCQSSNFNSGPALCLQIQEFQNHPKSSKGLETSSALTQCLNPHLCKSTQQPSEKAELGMLLGTGGELVMMSFCIISSLTPTFCKSSFFYFF